MHTSNLYLLRSASLSSPSFNNAFCLPLIIFQTKLKKNVGNKRFEEELQKQLLSVSDFGSFHFAFKVILNQFAPLKQKLTRNNNQPFMTKTLREAIMKRSKLRNKFNEHRNIENWSEYKR